MKAGFVAIYGKANAGKSTLLNDILGFKLMAVSEKPQTTRENIIGIYNDDDSQIVFIDTPGVFIPHKKLGSATSSGISREEMRCVFILLLLYYSS